MGKMKSNGRMQRPSRVKFFRAYLKVDHHPKPEPEYVVVRKDEEPE